MAATVYDRRLMCTVPEAGGIPQTAPDLWLDGTRNAENVGAREFTAASAQKFSLATAIDPGVQDFFVCMWMYGPAIIDHSFCTGATANARPGFNLSTYLTRLYLRLNDSVQATLVGGYLTDAVLPANVWTHIAVLFNRDGVASCYVNDTLQTVTVDISAHSATLGAYLNASAIGGTNSTGDFGGRLARIGYGEGSLLTAADVSELVNGGAGRLANQLSSALAAKMKYFWDGAESSGNLTSQIGSNTGTASASPPTAAAGPAHAASVNGGVVSPWKSRDATVHSFTQPTIANRPVFATASNSLTFDGTDYLKKSSAILSSATTGRVMIVAKTTDDDAEQVLYSQADEASATRYLQLGISAGNKIHYKYNNNGTADELVGHLSVGTGWHVFEWSTDGSAIEMRVDGWVQTLTIVGGANNGHWFGETGLAADNSILGAIQTTSVAGYLVGSITDVVAIEPDCTAANASRVRRKLARPQTIELYRPLRTYTVPVALYDAMDSSTGWTAVTGTVEASTDFFLHGSASLKIARDTATAKATKSVSPTINVSDGTYALRALVYVPDNGSGSRNARYPSVYLYEGTQYASYYIGATPGIGWHVMELPIPATGGPHVGWSVSASFTGTAVDKIAIECDTLSATGCAYFDELTIYRNINPVARICWVFDDFAESAITTMAAILEEYGWRGAFAAIGSLLDAPKIATGLALESRGHCVVNHSYAHTSWNDLSAADAKADLLQMQALMRTSGFTRGARLLVLPYGGWGTTVDHIHIARDYTDCVCGVTSRVDLESTSQNLIGSTGAWNPNLPTSMRTLARGVLGNLDLTDANVDKLVSRSGFEVIMQHALHTTGTKYYPTEAEFRAVCDHIAEQEAAGLLVVSTLEQEVYG